MQILKSQINPNSKEFQDNKKAYLELMARYREGMAMSMQGGGAVAIEKHKKRHKLLARERIDQLIDKNTPFLVYFITSMALLYHIILVCKYPYFFKNLSFFL